MSRIAIFSKDLRGQKKDDFLYLKQEFLNLPFLPKNAASKNGESLVSKLWREGLAYYRCCHEQAAEKLGELYRKQGFILHIDGTNEGGEFTHFICRDSFTGHTVFARLIRSENQEDVAQILKENSKGDL